MTIYRDKNVFKSGAKAIEKDNKKLEKKIEKQDKGEAITLSQNLYDLSKTHNLQLQYKIFFIKFFFDFNSIFGAYFGQKKIINLLSQEDRRTSHPPKKVL